MVPDNKMLNCYKLEAVANDKVSMTKKLKLISGRVENIAGKGQRPALSHFLNAFSDDFSLQGRQSHDRAVKRPSALV